MVGILRIGFRHQALTPLVGPSAATLYGRLSELYLDGADWLDSSGSVLFLRLRGALVGGLAAQFCSASTVSNACECGDSDRVCADLQPLFLNAEKALVLVRTNVCAGSLAACLGAVRDD